MSSHLGLVLLDEEGPCTALQELPAALERIGVPASGENA
jgi:hypothetical protein